MSKKWPFVWLYQRIRRRVPAILLMSAAHVGQALLGVFFALGTRQVIDCAVAGQPEAFGRACLWQGAIIGGILVCLTVYRHLRDRLTADLDRDWKEQILHGLLHGDYAAVSEYHSVELLNRLNNDVHTVDEGILTVLPNMVAMVTRLTAAMVVLMVLEPKLAWVILVVGILVVLVTGLIRRRLKALHKQVSEQDGRVSGFLQESLEKLLIVQAMDVSTEVERRADELLAQRYEMQRKRKNASLAANTGVSLMSYGAGFAALIWCADGLLAGRLSFGSLTAITQLVSQLQSPFVGLSGVIPKYIAMSAAVERLMELDAIQGEAEPMVESADALYQSLEAIQAEGLCFSFDRDTILQDITFTLPKGAFAVITGPSGIGKSTLLKLMLGVFRPDKGRLYADCGTQQVPLNRATRGLFAYVPQGNLLLSGTLRENLTIVNPDASEAEIAQALYVSAVDEYLPHLPLGLDTPLGENGAGLSEGQAQRLAIARAILGGAPILLLDESTSALDPQTEQVVLERIRVLPGRTCVVVTHRPAALELGNWNMTIHQEDKEN